MENNSEWREILREICKDRQERQRIARALGVDPLTVTRWANGETNPRPQYIRRLPEVVSGKGDRLRVALAKDFPHVTWTITEEVQREVREFPAEFYARVLQTKASIPERLLFSTLTSLVLEQTIKQIDSSRIGTVLILSACVPPASGDVVRSLRLVAGWGTAQWEGTLEHRVLLYGMESITGSSAAYGRLLVNHDLLDPFQTVAGYSIEGSRSSAAVPVVQVGSIAGCLCAASIETGYFVPWRLKLLEQCAELLSLAFREEAFFPQEKIRLGVFPRADIQWPLLASFQQRVSNVLREAGRKGAMLSIQKAEEIVWQQLEEELLHVTLQ